jgi:hypothetical protein
MNESIQAKNKHKIMIEFGFDYFGIFIWFEKLVDWIRK